MPSNYLSNPLIFLIDILFSIYITIIALRLIMQWAQWEQRHSLVQLIIKTTQVPVKLLRRFFPSFGKWDSATIILLFILTFIKLFLISFLQDTSSHQGFFFGWLIADVFALFITLFTFSILIEVFLSWIVPPHTQNHITPLIRSMNEPLLRPIRQKLPIMNGLDLSPLIVVLGLQVLSMLIIPILLVTF